MSFLVENSPEKFPCTDVSRPYEISADQNSSRRNKVVGFGGQKPEF